jgi:hypothetical protein
LIRVALGISGVDSVLGNERSPDAVGWSPGSRVAKVDSFRLHGRIDAGQGIALRRASAVITKSIQGAWADNHRYTLRAWQAMRASIATPPGTSCRAAPPGVVVAVSAPIDWPGGRCERKHLHPCGDLDGEGDDGAPDPILIEILQRKIFQAGVFQDADPVFAPCPAGRSSNPVTSAIQAPSPGRPSAVWVGSRPARDDGVGRTESDRVRQLLRGQVVGEGMGATDGGRSAPCCRPAHLWL